MLFSKHGLKLQHFLSSALSFWSSQQPQVLQQAAKQPDDIAVVFMILFGCCFTFEDWDNGGVGGGCKLNGRAQRDSA
ncbi:MAG: hypothetical protein M3275_01090 [Thermoproteota archaeon]|nr:hypothetical protein [Thermoproteota archaeon]